jgi:hypothetical protein
MEKTPSGNSLVLSIAPVSRGFGYAFFEGLDVLVDWETRDMHVARDPEEKNRRSLAAVETLLARGPAAVALPAWDDKRRSARVQKLIRAIAELATEHKLPVATHTRAEIEQVFAGQGAKSRYDMARVACRMFPELLEELPRKRRLWDGEPFKMGMFQAIILGIAHLALSKPPRTAPG